MKLNTKSKDFFEMLQVQIEKVIEGINCLYEFIHNVSKENGQKVKRVEKEADEIRRFIINKLNKAFVTPMDREDIFSLSRIFDDIVDYAKSTVNEMLLFEVRTNPYLKRMVSVLKKQTEYIGKAVKNLKRAPNEALEFAANAKKAENEMEHLYHEALVRLFKESNVILILKLREIYRHLSNAADRADEAGNRIGDIVVKST